MFFAGLLFLFLIGVLLIMFLMAIAARGIAEDRKNEGEITEHTEKTEQTEDSSHKG